MTPEQAWSILLQALVVKGGLSLPENEMVAQAKQVIEKMIAEAIRSKEQPKQ